MYEFPHERLDCYRVALEVNQWLKEQRFEPSDKDTSDQVTRASNSMLLNIAEGASSRGKQRAYHFRKTQASAAEVCACLDTVMLSGSEDQQQKLRRVGAMLTKM